MLINAASQKPDAPDPLESPEPQKQESAEESNKGMALDSHLKYELTRQFEQIEIIAQKLETALEPYKDPSNSENIDTTEIEGMVKELRQKAKLELNDDKTKIADDMQTTLDFTVDLANALAPFKNRSNPHAQPIAHVEDLLIELRNKGKLLLDGVKSEKPEDIYGTTEGEKPKQYAEPDRFQQGAHKDPHEDQEPA